MRALLIEIGLVLAVAIGVGVGYVLWGTPPNWYANVPMSRSSARGRRTISSAHGKDLIVDTPRLSARTRPILPCAIPATIGLPELSFECRASAVRRAVRVHVRHLPDDDRRSVLTLTRRINGCMRRSMNGVDLPSEGREMEALIAYFSSWGKAHPRACASRHGSQADRQPRPRRPTRVAREDVYAKHCATCHKETARAS